jgi:hypothetical protein
MLESRSLPFGARRRQRRIARATRLLTGLLLALLLISPTAALAQTGGLASLAQPAAARNDQPPTRYPLPPDWQGTATIDAQQLADTAPPLRADVIQGDFQIVYVPVETGATLRLLPVAADAATRGSLRLGVLLEAGSALPFPAGGDVTLAGTVRVYAPEASARLWISDESGRSEQPVDSLNWQEFSLTRAIPADATVVEFGLEWLDVPANGWLEVRGLTVALPTPAAAQASATPKPSAEPTSVPTAEPTAVPTALPTAQPTATPTEEPLPTQPPTATPEITPTPLAIQAELPTATPYATPTPELIIVTSTPTPVDIFEEATRVAIATEWARILGPATPTPPNMVTPTPTLTPIVVVNTPTPANAATATLQALRATAVAFTTGTPTPYPADAVILVATNTPTPAPRATNTPRPTATPTPIFVLLDNIPVAQPAPTVEVPAALYGKIVFLTNFRGNPRAPNAMVMNPDGTDVALLTTNLFYNQAAARDNFSADGRYRVYSLREGGGTANNAGLTQLFYDDAFYNSTGHQLTYFGTGVAWSPAWSPTSETIALVSSESANDEIWVVKRGEWPPLQLTKNDWAWDHHPSFSPDGSEIVFSSNRSAGRRQIWVMDVGGGNQRQLTNFPFEAWDPVWVKYTAGTTP